MGTVTPDILVEALRDWRVDVAKFEPGGTAWHRATTPGGWNPRGVMHHHTTGPATLLTSQAAQLATLRVLRFGRKDLPGPLCHLAPAMVPGTKRARVWLIGWGNVNHAGMGSSVNLGQISAAQYRGKAPIGPGTVDGNPHFWGLEYLHPGVSAVAWPDALLEVGHRAAAAICDAQGWTVNPGGRNIEHREWTTRKTDRSWHGDVRGAVHDLWLAENVGVTLHRVIKYRPWYPRYMRGADVAAVQRVIGADPDGKYGPGSRSACKRWQLRRGLVADGDFGPASAREAGWRYVP